MNKKLREHTEYLLSREQGTIFKDPGGRINVALVYPNRYSVGMSSLGFQLIYGLLNGFADVVCERCFFPDDRDMEEYVRTGAEPFTLESRRPLSRFHIIAFSVSFENDYPHIVKMLDMARIPPRSADRGPSHPIVMMGGACAFFNPEPLADFFDICCIGEAEELLGELLEAYRSAGTREQFYSHARRIEGVYLPRCYAVSSDEHGGILRREALDGAPAVIRKRTAQDFSRSVPWAPIITPEAEFSGMHLLEVMRGCSWSCRFCVAGHIYRPVRKKDPDVLRENVQEALLRTPKVGLIGPSLSDYPSIEAVLATDGVDFSITSLRASRRSAGIVELMKGHRSVSIAPEAGTERMRRIINKKITEDDILETSALILESGIETLRLYFMIGLPGETLEDSEGIVTLVKKIRAQSRRGAITLSVSTFVPKPFTPFQWHPMEPVKEVKKRAALIRKGLSREKGLRVFHDVPKYAYVQGIFARGDRKVAEGVAMMASGGEQSVKSLLRDFQDDYVMRSREYAEALPWDFIDAGVDKARLWEEYREALSE